MSTQKCTQNIDDSYYSISKIQSSHFIKPPIVKHLRRHHHSIIDFKHHFRTNKKRRPISTIHVTVRPRVNIIHSSVNKLNRHINDFYSFSTILAGRHHENAPNKSSTTSVKVIKKSNISEYPCKISPINSNDSPIPSQPSQNLWHNEKSTTAKDEWPDWTNFENQHHKNRKKKKKCTRLRKMLLIIAILLIIVIVAVILIVLLLKLPTNKTINRTAILRWNSTGITVAGITGQKGNASNLLNFPFGITIDYANTLYITDTYNNRIQKYLNSASSGITVAGQADGTLNTTSFYLNSPCDVAVDANGNVYVADTFNHRIQFWSNGSSSGGITLLGNGTLGSTTNQLNRPYGLFHDSNSGILYIDDSGNNRVLSLIPGQSSGTIIAGGHGGGFNNTQLYSPNGLYFDSVSNSIFIANSATNSIVQWILGASSWILVAGNATSSSGSTSRQLFYPFDVTLDPMGNIYVADTNNQRIQFFSVGQSIGETIAGITSTAGNSSILLTQPLSVVLDSQLNLYVSDAGNHRIQKFLRY